MNYTKIISILDDHFCEKWFEFVFTLIDKSTIDLINLLDTKYLTKEIFDNITFKVEDSECFISYKNFKDINNTLQKEGFNVAKDSGNSLIRSMANMGFDNDSLEDFSKSKLGPICPSDPAACKT